MRLDLNIEEDMAEEIGRIIGYDRVLGSVPQIEFKTKGNETYAKISLARNKLLDDGYSEVMTYVFCDKGEVEVMQSASDKKFLRTNLTDGVKESLKLNKTNAPLLGLADVKIFEIGTVFLKDHEEIRVCYGDKKEIKELSLDEFVKNNPSNPANPARTSDASPEENSLQKFRMWSLFPFIARDVAVWATSEAESQQIHEVIKESMGDMVVKGPDLFDTFTKEGKTSYAFKLIFQSYERTLTDVEVNEVMAKIADNIKAKGWEVR